MARNSGGLFGIIVLLLLVGAFPPANAWSNGGYSEDKDHLKYGTHDWIAEHALDWLPAIEKQYILDDKNAYLYGTEYPDNPKGYGDTTNHHVYYHADGTLQDDTAAGRAKDEYQFALTALKAKDFPEARQRTGALTHYISDIAVFGHIMGSKTDWGSETHHSDYEDYVNNRTPAYTSPDFDKYLTFDGNLDNITAYNATLDLAYETTFDRDGPYDCLWMDNNTGGDTPPPDIPPPDTNVTGDHPLINEFEPNPLGTDAGNEWTELFNPTATVLDLNGWKLKNNDEDYYSLSGSLDAGEYKVIIFPTQWLDNTDEGLTLLNPDSDEVDKTLIKADGDNDDKTWQRSSDSSWVFQPGTKGAANSRESSRAYDWNDEAFKTRSGESLNYAVNLIADVLHHLAWESGYVGANATVDDNKDDRKKDTGPDYGSIAAGCLLIAAVVILIVLFIIRIYMKKKKIAPASVSKKVIKKKK